MSVIAIFRQSQRVPGNNLACDQAEERSRHAPRPILDSYLLTSLTAAAQHRTPKPATRRSEGLLISTGGRSLWRRQTCTLGLRRGCHRLIANGLLWACSEEFRMAVVSLLLCRFLL